MAIKVCLTSLGCAKNLVDSEQMLKLMVDSGMEIVSENESADVALINTCGFIEAAKTEAIEEILKAVKLKNEGRLSAIVVAGCLTQRYRDEFFHEFPEVDCILGTGSYHEIAKAVQCAINGQKGFYFEDIDSAPQSSERILTTPGYYAYLKISEGCDNHCAYCVIPSLRGKYRSRKLEELIDEAEALAKSGVKELIIIAQDITRYGLDLYGERCLVTLLKELCKVEGIEWIRLHYLYPDEIPDGLIEVIAEEPKILHYFDIPIQHACDTILKAMNRRGDKQYITRLFSKIRKRIPDAIIRTSVIVGFPGETEKEFSELCAFLREMRLERAGVFCYSREEGSKAYDYSGQVPQEIKEERREILEEIEYVVMADFNESLTGKTVTILCEGFDEERGFYYGRSYMDSPDIDLKTYFTSEELCTPGDFVSVQILGADGLDLVGQAKSIGRPLGE